jgi:hypothetical protein
VLVELPHESDAELANLVISLALRVEVTATLTTAHVDCGRRLAHVLNIEAEGATYGR